MSSHVDQPQHPNIATSSDGEPVTSVPPRQDPLLIVTPPYSIHFTQDSHIVRSIHFNQEYSNASLDPCQDPSIVHTTQPPQDPVVAGITEIFDRNDPDIDFPVCVCKVPNSLSASKPEAYCPQVVGLGPLHHNRSELATMLMYKLSVARKIHRGFGRRVGFKTLIKGILKLMPSLRACYQMYLMDNNSLVACTMATDGLFLFGLLCSYGIGKDALSSSETLRSLIDPADTRLAQDGILRDAMMLENQIPMIALKNILLMESLQPRKKKSPIVDYYLPKMLLGFCKALSPLKVLEYYPPSIALKRYHLLDLLYELVTLEQPPMEDVPGAGQEEEGYEHPAGTETKSLESAFWDVTLHLAIPNEVKQPLQLVKGIRELPWSNLYSSFQNKAPVMEEILIPTASNLCDVGVKFSSSNRITGIVFDPVTASFKLPIVKLNNNSEVVIRNLVAYEAMYKPESEPLVFTGYIEMMSGIIQTAEDVKALRDHQVLDIEFLKDDDVVKIFTGMSKPVRSANAPNIDKAITDVNNFYNGTTKGKARKFIKKWGSILWRNGRIVAAILLLSLMALETFCSVYGCPRIFEKTT